MTWRAVSRVLEYGYEMLAENVMDPAHFPFAHHGVGPLRREQGRAFPHISVIPQSEGAWGFVGRLLEPFYPSFSPVYFLAPSVFVYHRSLGHPGASPGGYQGEDVDFTAVKELTMAELQSEGEGRAEGDSVPLLVTALYMTPVSPGRSRLTFLEGYSGLPPLAKWLIGLRWPLHLIMHQVLDGDAFFLHAQDKATLRPRNPRNSGGGGQGQHPRPGPGPGAGAGAGAGAAKDVRELPSSRTPEYFLPTSSDRFVVALKRWMHTWAGGGVDWHSDVGQCAGMGADWAPKELVLDRFSAHTSQCSPCQHALAWVRRLRSFLASASLGVAVLLLRLPAHVGAPRKVLVLAGSVVCALLAFGAHSLARQFCYVGYNHAQG